MKKKYEYIMLLDNDVILEECNYVPGNRKIFKGVFPDVFKIYRELEQKMLHIF